MDRSSIAVRDEAKMLRRTAGVTGMRPFDDAGGESGTFLYDRRPLSEDAIEDGMTLGFRIQSNPHEGR